MSAVEERRIAVGILSRVVRGVFGSLGMPEPGTEVMSERMLFADLRGFPSHGVALLPYYVGLVEGGVDVTGSPNVKRERGATIVVDGANTMGHIAASFGMEAALDLAAELGVGVAAVGSSNHCGAVAAYATMALERGMIGLATSNALPTMAPPGGADRIVGLNPLAIAFPSEGGVPFVLDASFGVAARARIVLHDQQGTPLPGGWAFDADGQPTTDPAAALAGLLAPAGGAKGVGIAVAMGVLSTLLSGAAYGTELGSLEGGPKPGRDGHFLMALDISAFVEEEEFKRRMEGVLQQLRSSRPAGDEPVRTPGERAFAAQRDREANGVPLADATHERLVELANRLELPVARELE